MEVDQRTTSVDSTTVSLLNNIADESVDLAELMPFCACCCCLFAPDAVCFPLQCTCQLGGIATKLSLCEILKICLQCCEIKQCCDFACTCCRIEDGKCCHCKGGAHLCSCKFCPSCVGCHCCSSTKAEAPIAEIAGPSFNIESARLPKFVPPEMRGKCLEISCCPWTKDFVYGCNCKQACCGWDLMAIEHGCPCSACCFTSTSGLGFRILSGSALPCMINVLGFTFCFQYKCVNGCCSRVQTMANKAQAAGQK